MKATLRHWETGKKECVRKNGGATTAPLHATEPIDAEGKALASRNGLASETAQISEFGHCSVVDLHQKILEISQTHPFQGFPSHTLPEICQAMSTLNEPGSKAFPGEQQAPPEFAVNQIQPALETTWKQLILHLSCRRCSGFMNSSSLHSDSTFQICPSQPAGAKCGHVWQGYLSCSCRFCRVIQSTLLSLIKVTKESIRNTESSRASSYPDALPKHLEKMTTSRWLGPD